MRTNIQKRFGIVQDVRAVEDPWGFGITFFIRREGHPAYRAFVDAEQKANPVMRIFFGEIAREQLKAGFTGKKLDMEAVAERSVEKANFDDEQMERYTNSQIRSVAHLLDEKSGGWEGLTDADTDEPVPFSIDAAIELLSSPEKLTAGMPYAELEIEGTDAAGNPTKRLHLRTLGEALQAFIQEEAKNGEAFIEAAEKN